MRFQVGKYYKHNGGEYMHVLCALRTAIYGSTMIAEFNDGSFRPVGDDEANTVNWTELEYVDEWEDLFT
jgi:hypothetical protein